MKYRSEIDGLRALAVLPVILFHAGFSVFSGGFIGVDVFFVISGYLITTILINELEEGRFSILRFYERRARRILPALFTVILCTLPFAWVWMLPSQFKDFSQSLMAVSLFASNIYFFLKSGYFSPASEELPMLHTWSLAVEEQYYLIFPVFLLLAWRFGRARVFWMIIGFSALSLALSEWSARHMPSANFYLAHTRAWELFAGSIAAFIASKRGVRANDLLAAIGLAAIVFSIFWFDDSTPFPSLYALLPVGGVVLLVLFGGAGTLAARLLGLKPVVAIGLISYSAYLWHQPLFAFARIRQSGEPSHAVMGALAAAALALAWLSWRFVEQPFRGKTPLLPSRRALFTASGAALVALAGFGAAGHVKNGFDFRLSPSDRALYAFTKYEKKSAPLYRKGKCFLTVNQTYADYAPECTMAGGAVIWGDSHAAALSVGLRRRFDAVTQRTATSCPPILPYRSAARPHCFDTNAAILAEIAAAPPKTVLLHASWASYSAGLAEGVEQTLHALKAAGVEDVVVIGGMPRYRPTLPEGLIRAGADLQTPMRLKTDLHFVRAQDSALRQAVQKAGARFVDAVGVICENEACFATIETENGIVPVAWDYAHLTEEGSVFVTEKLFGPRP